MRKVLIIGANGFVGSHLIKEFQKSYQIRYFSKKISQENLDSQESMMKSIMDSDVIVNVAYDSMAISNNLLINNLIVDSIKVAAVGKLYIHIGTYVRLDLSGIDNFKNGCISSCKIPYLLLKNQIINDMVLRSAEIRSTQMVNLDIGNVIDVGSGWYRYAKFMSKKSRVKLPNSGNNVMPVVTLMDISDTISEIIEKNNVNSVHSSFYTRTLITNVQTTWAQFFHEHGVSVDDEASNCNIYDENIFKNFIMIGKYGRNDLLAKPSKLMTTKGCGSTRNLRYIFTDKSYFSPSGLDRVTMSAEVFNNKFSLLG